MSKHFSLYNINKKGNNPKPSGFNFGSGVSQSSRSNPSPSACHPSNSSNSSNSFNASDEIEFKQSQFKYPTTSNVAGGDSSLNKKRTFVNEPDRYCATTIPDSPSHGIGQLQHSQNKASKQKFSAHAQYSDSQSDHQRPGTACAPPKLSFPRPASDAGSTGTSTLGNNPFYQNHNEPANPLSLIFQSSHQMQQEALSVLLARQADLEKFQKQKNSLTRELESAKLESQNFKTDAIDLKNSLSIQRKWNAVVDIRLKSLVSARDSILHCLQIIRAKSHTYQTSIEELEKQVMEVKTECKKQNELRMNLQNENHDLKKSISTATSELEAQSTHFSDMKEAIARNSSELSTLIHKLSFDKDSKIDAKFDIMHSLVNQSKGEVSKKLFAIINHNSELEKSVAEFETRLGHIIESSTERQISAATEIQSQLTLSDVQKEAFCKELKDTYTQQLSEKEEKLEEQSLLLAELTKDKCSLSSQVVELTAHSASLQARLDIIICQHSSAIEKLQSDLEEGEKILLSSKITVASLSEQLNASKKETMSLETRLSDLNQEIINLKTAAAKTNHELAESAMKLSISRTEIASLFKENEVLQDRGNFNSLIENRLEKVLSAFSMKEEKETSQLRIEITNLQEKYESLLSQNRELQNHEMTLNKKIEELKKLDSEKENLAPEFSSRIADLEKLLQEETRKSEEKSRADTTSIASLREKLTQKEQDLENCKYKADSELKVMKEKTDALQRDLDNLRLNRNMSRSLSDIEAQKTGNVKPNHVSSLAAVKKEAASARLRNSKRGIFKHSAHETKGNQRKISEKISPSESFDLFEAPF